jgi:hypothetical protein
MFNKKIEAYKLQEGSELLHSLQGLPFQMLYQDGSIRELPEFKIVRPANQGYDRNMFVVEYTRGGEVKSFSHKKYYDDGSPFMLAFDLNEDSTPDPTPGTARGRRKTKRRRRRKNSRRRVKRYRH